MTTRQAQIQARLRFGPTGGIHERREAFNADERAAIRGRVRDLLKLKATTTGTARVSILKELKSLEWKALAHRFNVGVISGGIAFMVRGQGDTWEEAFAAVK